MPKDARSDNTTPIDTETAANPSADAEPEAIAWKSFDGKTITGFLYRPPTSFAGPRPVIVNIHGGPEGQTQAGFLGRKIGNLIADVMEKVGKDGVITVEEGKGLQFETEFVEGMKFDRGYISPYFITNAEQMRAELEDLYILITDKKISAINDILPALEKIVQVSKNMAIIA